MSNDSVKHLWQEYILEEMGHRGQTQFQTTRVHSNLFFFFLMTTVICEIHHKDTWIYLHIKYMEQITEERLTIFRMLIVVLTMAVVCLTLASDSNMIIVAIRFSGTLQNLLISWMLLAFQPVLTVFIGVRIAVLEDYLRRR